MWKMIDALPLKPKQQSVESPEITEIKVQTLSLCSRNQYTEWALDNIFLQDYFFHLKKYCQTTNNFIWQYFYNGKDLAKDIELLKLFFKKILLIKYPIPNKSIIFQVGTMHPELVKALNCLYNKNRLNPCLSSLYLCQPNECTETFAKSNQFYQFIPDESFQASSFISNSDIQLHDYIVGSPTFSSISSEILTEGWTLSSLEKSDAFKHLYGIFTRNSIYAYVNKISSTEQSSISLYIV